MSDTPLTQYEGMPWVDTLDEAQPLDIDDLVVVIINGHSCDGVVTKVWGDGRYTLTNPGGWPAGQCLGTYRREELERKEA